jgi:hypothetical protein
MNELLELMRMFVVAGWLYLCILLVVSLALLAFDRRGAAPDPEFSPAGIRPVDPRVREPQLHSDPIAADRA